MKDYGGGLSRGGWVLEPGFLSQSSGLSANYKITQRHVLNRIFGGKEELEELQETIQRQGLS